MSASSFRSAWLVALVVGAFGFGCASGSEASEELPPPGDTGIADSTGGGDDTAVPTDSGGGDDTGGGGDTATDTGPPSCKTNADCASDPAGKFCLPASDGGKSYCVPCLPAPFDECGVGTYCSDTTYTCEAGCKTTADCVPSAGDAGPDGGDGGDAADAEVGGGSVVCDAVKHRCVGCIADPDCPAGFLCDRPSGACVPGCTMAKPCPTGKDCCSGSCKDTQKDLANCGTCGNTCAAPANATAGCNAGTCGIGMCNTGFGDCNSSASDGCETNTATNKDNCGACGTVCSLANATAACSAGACTIGTCNGGYADCDVIASTGCETRLNTVMNCGMCGRTCTIPNGTGECSTGTCAVASCNPGFGDCDGVTSNGCETNINAGTPAGPGTIQNCGSCGTSCSVANGTPSCLAGSCAVNSCTPPYANCDGLYGNGCETNTLVSTSHCGGCSNACSSAGGSATCSSGVCGIACTPGFGNCDGLAANGCERNLTNDPNNCNGCGVVCATSPTVLAATCQPMGITGACKVGTCAANTYDQNGIFSDGCECAEDTVGNTCAASRDLGTVNVGATLAPVSGNLVGAGPADEDWYKISFQTISAGSPSCNYTPSVTLSSSGGVKMQVFTNCAGAGYACQVGGIGPTEPATSSSTGIDSWEFRMAGADGSARSCGDNLQLDPIPGSGGAGGTGSLVMANPPVGGITTIYVRVFRSATLTTCYPYTLTIGN